MAYVGPAQRRQGVYCREHWEAVGYPLLNSRYHYTVKDVFVRATLVETYQAQTNVEREIAYIFEVPPEASVIGFTAKVGNTVVKAIVDEKAEADKKYQAAKTAGVQAWKLDKVNEEVFQISLGAVSPNSTIEVHVDYVYVISSDTIEDSVRLTIPAGLADRPGSGPASVTTVPTAPTGSDAVIITVSIEVERSEMIFDLNCLTHHASITNGFSDNSFKALSPVEKRKAYKQWKSYVEFTSSTFLKHHFVLSWTVPRIDQGRCIVEQLSPTLPGQSPTLALALTLVSNLSLNVDEHEYIFLVDYSGSMAGSRIKMANNVVENMLSQLPSHTGSTFNIYNFNTSAWSILAGGKSVVYDQKNASAAVSSFRVSATGGTNIDAALTKVLNERDASKRRSSVIVITDGLDWGVTAAMRTVQQHAATAAGQSKLLRVFVMGLGNDVSRGMCEGLARAGAGATAYISETLLQDRDHGKAKAETLVNAINYAPVRVRSIDWHVDPAPAKAGGGGGGGGDGENKASRPKPNQAQLGAVAKGDNLPPPKAIQQAPLPGTMFWAIRSYWYAIVDGTSRDSSVTINYDIPGSGSAKRTIEVPKSFEIDERVIHSVAAHALIQTFEQKLLTQTNPTDKYWTEAEIVRLGKRYGLASSQTSFVATMNGTGEITYTAGNATQAKQSLLAGVPVDNNSSLGFVSAQASPAPAAAPQARFMSMAMESEPFSTRMAVPQPPYIDDAHADAGVAAPGAAAGAGADNLSAIISAQSGNGAFDSAIIERVVFPSTGVPAIPAFISSLEGRDNVKEQIWLAVCAMAYFRQKEAGREREWSDAGDKAGAFVKTTLCCVFGVDAGRSGEILSNSLDDAEGYF
ncbi:hypothetical protein MY11210_009388 [Beauveria gryllotalpidicola]